MSISLAALELLAGLAKVKLQCPNSTETSNLQSLLTGQAKVRLLYSFQFSRVTHPPKTLYIATSIITL